MVAITVQFLTRFACVLGPMLEVVFRTAGRHTCLVTPGFLCQCALDTSLRMRTLSFAFSFPGAKHLQALTVLTVRESSACFQVRRGHGRGRRLRRAPNSASAWTSEDTHGRSLRVHRVSRRRQCLLRGTPTGRKHRVQDVPRCLVGDQDACSVHMHLSTFASCCSHVVTLGVAGGSQDMFSDPTPTGSMHSWGRGGDRVR